MKTYPNKPLCGVIEWNAMKLIYEAVHFNFKNWNKWNNKKKREKQKAFMYKLKINFQIKTKFKEQLFILNSIFVLYICAWKIFKNIPKHIMEKINFYRHGKCVI